MWLTNTLWPRAHIIPTQEIARRLTSYISPPVVSELYTFGRLLLDENFSRKSQLESKATVVVGYGGAMLAFLLARLPNSGAHSISNLAAIPALLALVCAFAAARVHTQNWLSDDTLVPEKLPLSHSDESLRLHYFECLYEINGQIKTSNQRKGNLLWFAQWLLLIAVLIVGVALIVEWHRAIPRNV